MPSDRWQIFLRLLIPMEAILLGLYLYLGNAGIPVHEQDNTFWVAAIAIFLISAWRVSGGHAPGDAPGAQRARAVLNALGEERGNSLRGLRQPGA